MSIGYKPNLDPFKTFLANNFSKTLYISVFSYISDPYTYILRQYKMENSISIISKMTAIRRELDNIVAQNLTKILSFEFLVYMVTYLIE